MVNGVKLDGKAEPGVSEWGQKLDPEFVRQQRLIAQQLQESARKSARQANESSFDSQQEPYYSITH